MQSNIDSAPGCLTVVAKNTKERVKCSRWVCVQECLPKTRLACLAYRQVLPLVSGVTKACFPIPSLKIVTKFSHLTSKSNVKQRVPVSELLAPSAGVVNTAKPN